MFDRGGVILGSKGLWLYDCVVLKKRYSGNTGQKDKRKAKTWVEDFKAAKRREAANSIIGIQADPTFDCHFLLQEWLANHSGKHASNVKADWDNYILPKIGSTPVMKVTTGMVEEIRTNYIRTPSFLNVKGKVADRMKAKALQTKAEGKQPKEKVSKPKTNNGANKVINHLNFVFSWGVKTDRLPRMPFKKLKKLVEQEAVKTFLRPEQVKPFLSEIDSLNNLPVMVMIRAMLYIGLREGEAVAMKWTGFDEGRKVFTASNAVEIGLINVASAYIREIKGIGYTLNPELIDLMKEWRRACGLPEVDTARKASGEREKAREARIQQEMEALSDGHWHEGLMRLTCLFATCEEFIARLETHPEFRKKADRYKLAISLRESHDAKNERNGFVWNGKPTHLEEVINIEDLMKYTQTVSFSNKANEA